MNALTESQRRAVAARGNALVAAGAGTGKTSTLVERCLALLEEGCSLEDILLVTFTDAAAVEMRSRIREALHERHRVGTADGSGGAGRREHWEKQLALLDTALISTLHSFCLQLVREHFYELGLDPDVAVLDGNQLRPLIRQTLDALFERHCAGETPADRAVQSLVRRQGGGSEERIRSLLQKLHRYTQARPDPDRWLDAQQALFSRPKPDRWREWLEESFPDWCGTWLPALVKLAGNPAVDAAVAELQKARSQPAPDRIVQALRSIRAADEDEASWPRGSRKNVRQQVKGFFEETAFLASLMPADGIDPLVEDWDFVRRDMVALVELTREFTADFNRAKRDLGGLDFADLEQLALRVLRQPGSGEPTAAALRWRRQLQYVFVDEYQDINAVQDAILTALSREGAEGNRFLVGDVKQSIYRFRLADPTIFRGYEERWGQGAAGAQRLPLADNFRSRPAVLDFVNGLFGALMRPGVGGVAYEELRGGNTAACRTPADSAKRAARVEFHLIARGGQPGAAEDGHEEESAGTWAVADLLATEREARLAALRLRELKDQGHEIWDKDEKRLRPARWGDMAVLLRSPASRVEAFAKEFARLGVPLEAARGGFFDSLEISDLVSLLRLLDNPMQDIPLLAVLRSPLVGMSVAELAQVCAPQGAAHRSLPFWPAARRFVQPGTEAGPAWRKLNRFFKQLDLWRDLVRQTSLSQCLETALAETHYESLLWARPRGAQQAANVRRLLKLAREYDPYQRQGLFRFLRFVDAQQESEFDLDPAPETADAVRLMSIHRSKGLEFPIVALAGLGGRFNQRDLGEAILVDGSYGLCPKILPPDGEQAYPSLPHWLARRRQRGELLGEELRLLYVAMTRARDTLLLTATTSGTGDPRWTADATGELSDHELLSARSPLDWLRLWLPRATRAEDWRGERAGESRLLRWTIYSEDDARLALGEEAPATPSCDPAARAGAGHESDLVELGARVNWIYPHQSATGQRAKTSATELRRQREEEEAVPMRFVRRPAFPFPAEPVHGLTAAEIGVAHHRFLERMSLAGAGSADELRREVERLKQAKWLTEREAASLRLDSLAAFWQSELGRRVAASSPSVRRELAFTARFPANELAGVPAGNPAGAGDEFVVVQGVADLVVIRAREIWLVDFKTDEVNRGELDAKRMTYQPQLDLYARALERIYGRPVTECYLHFLSCDATVAVER